MSAPRCSLLDGMEGRKLMFGLTYKTPAIGSLSQAGLTWRGIIMCEARLPMARAYCFHRSADERLQVGPFSTELGKSAILLPYSPCLLDPTIGKASCR